MTTATQPHEVTEENATKFLDWLNTRGGILVWRSVSTPARNMDGTPFANPGWQFTHPERHITSIDDVVVVTSKEVARCKKLKLEVRGQYGQKMQLTTGSSNRLNRMLDARPGSYYVFASTGTSHGDPIYGMMMGEDEAIILVDDKVVPLKEWKPKEDAP